MMRRFRQVTFIVAALAFLSGMVSTTTVQAGEERSYLMATASTTAAEGAAGIARSAVPTEPATSSPIAASASAAPIRTAARIASYVACRMLISSILDDTTTPMPTRTPGVFRRLVAR